MEKKYRDTAERFLKDEVELMARISSDEYGPIVAEWVVSNNDPVLLVLISRRMVEIHEFRLRDITNYKDLIFLRGYSSPGSMARKQVEARMFEVNKIQYHERAQILARAIMCNEEQGTYHEIEDYDVLMVRWKHSTLESALQEQIETLIAHSNSECNDYEQLIVRFKQAERESIPQKLAKSRMRELNVACSDEDELIRRREVSLYNHVAPCLVDERILELRHAYIKSIHDYTLLIQERNSHGRGSATEKYIEEQMMELNKTELPKMTNYRDLIWRRENSTPDSLLQKQIEARMIEMLDAVDPYNIPYWVIERLKSPDCFERQKPKMYFRLSHIAKQILALE